MIQRANLCHNLFSARDYKITAIAIAVAAVVAVECTTIPVKILNEMENFCGKL
jgi:hypothetical protein